MPPISLAPARHRARHLARLLTGVLLLLSVRAAPGGAEVNAEQRPAVALTSSLAAGARAERNGDDLLAEAEYRAVAGATDPVLAAAGRLALGRFLVRRDRAAEALAPLRSAATALAGATDGLRATFLLGEAEAGLGQNQAAAAAFEAYIAGGGAASGYAALSRARAWQADGNDAEALAALTVPLQSASLPLRRAALQAAGRSHERLDELPAAIDDQHTLIATRPPLADRATALVAAGRLYRRAGDDADAAAAFQQVVQAMPDTSAAGTALAELDALGVTADPLQRAVVLFDLGRSDGARSAFQGLLDGGPSNDLAAAATYYLARIADRADDNDAAQAGYADAIALAPGGPLAADAMWRRAQLLKLLGRYGDAGQAYTDLARQFPQGEHAAAAAFQAGLMAYLDGRPDASATWTAIAQASSDETAAAANLWLAKLALAQGDAATASTRLVQAQTLHPYDYESLRAAVLSGNATPVQPGVPVSPPHDDWSAVEAWLAGWAGPEDLVPFSALQRSENWIEAMELDALGWQITPNTLLREAIAEVSRQPWALYRAARALAGRGRTTIAIDATEELLQLAADRPDGVRTVPVALLRLAYPVDFPGLINADAARFGLDPLLLAAVARQESGFDPTAGSSAGARGLLQLEPDTARMAADRLGITDYSAAQLERPRLNLELGAAVLAQGARTQDGDLNRTLAAYNAGGGNARRWADQAGGDSDRFYEAIDFGETRHYIRRVTRNYLMYMALYRGVPSASLPLS